MGDTPSGNSVAFQAVRCLAKNLAGTTTVVGRVSGTTAVAADTALAATAATWGVISGSVYLLASGVTGEDITWTGTARARMLV